MQTIIQQPLSAEQLITQNYISILEKTNQQLNLWSNPYGIMVGTLTLLFAIMAIGVSVYLWWNSREQRKERKEQADNFFSNLEKIAKNNIEEARKQYDILIAAQEKVLTSSTKNKTEIEKELLELKKERANIGTSINSQIGGNVWGTTEPLRNINISGGGGGSLDNSILWKPAGTVLTGPTRPYCADITGHGIGGRISDTAVFNQLCPKCNTFCFLGQQYCTICGTKLKN